MSLNIWHLLTFMANLKKLVPTIEKRDVPICMINITRLVGLIIDTIISQL